MKIKKKSNWVYDTSSGGDLGILIVSIQKGTLKLKNMSDRRTATLYYGAAGVSQGLSLPIGWTFSTEEMPSSGDVFLSDNVSGPDLKPSDFDGLCFIHGASFDAGGMGASRNMLFFGIPWTKVPTQILKGIASNLIDIKSYLLGPLYQIYKAGKLVFGSSGDLPNILRPLVGEAKGVILTQGQVAGPALASAELYELVVVLPTSLSFSNQAVGTTSASQTVKLR